MSSELMVKLEGMELTAYDDTKGLRTVGIGFNMDSAGAREIWEKLHIDLKHDFDKVYNQEEPITQGIAYMLFRDFWSTCRAKARKRCEELDLVYSEMPEYKRFILADIAYNTGSVSKWKKVFEHKKPKEILFEARRHPYEMMDSRVAKIGRYFGIIKSVEEAKEIGLEYTKYI